MTSQLHKLAGSRFARFLFTGGLAATANIVSRHYLSQTMSFRWAVVIAYLIGMTAAWILARLMVFEPSGRHWSSEFTRFGLVNIVAAIQVWITSVGLAEWVFPHLGYNFHPEFTAHVIGVILPVFTSYFGHKHFSFAQRVGV